MEVIGLSGGVDYVELTAEYVSFGLDDLDNLARASELYDMSTMIKVDQSLQVFLAQRAVGSGFQAVLFTDVRTADDARTCVEAVRPDTPGSTGIYGSINRRNAGYIAEVGSPDYIKSLHDIVVAIMIEKKPAVENLDGILSVEGLDMVQFGPGDYSHWHKPPGPGRSDGGGKGYQNGTGQWRCSPR